MRKPKNFTEWNEDYIFNLMKKWKQRAEQAHDVIKLYKSCNGKTTTPRDFFYELRTEKILNNKKHD